MTEPGIAPLLKKKELLTKVYEMTKAVKFTGGEDDADAYTNLMERRELLFNEIKILDDEISGIDQSTDAYGIMDDIKKTAEGIVALDRENEAAASKIIDGLKKSLKGINEGKHASIKYTDFIPTSDGMYFDQKN